MPINNMPDLFQRFFSAAFLTIYILISVSGGLGDGFVSDLRFGGFGFNIESFPGVFKNSTKP
jgi:hypothetical protein